ncbi:MAG: large subunit ribosomal protein [Candidatus Sumerlaeota bacterium]|nr:large subunit ribosomal protein [Candidatus Sumerlaeota bacterium]
MARVKNTPATKSRRKKILKAARGAYSGRHRLFKSAKETVQKGWQYAYNDRKLKKREYRALWIVRINAACRENGMAYSRLINGLNMAGIEIDRKMLAEIAVNDPAAFTSIVETARKALETSKEPTAARQVPRI